MEALPLSLCVVNTDNQITYINDFLPRRLGQSYRHFYGKTPKEAFAPFLTKKRCLRLTAMILNKTGPRTT